MSFPGFNISKATPTTSTSNENTRANPSIEKDPSSTSSSTLFGIALHSSPITADSASSPPFRPSEAVPISSVTQTLASQDINSDTIRSDNALGLLGLFDKFDVKSPGESLERLSSEANFPDLNEKSEDYEDNVVDEKIESIIDQLNLLELQEMIQKLGREDVKEVSPIERDQSLMTMDTKLNKDEDDSDTEQRRRLENALLNLTDEEEGVNSENLVKRGDIYEKGGELIEEREEEHSKEQSTSPSVEKRILPKEIAHTTDLRKFQVATEAVNETETLENSKETGKTMEEEKTWEKQVFPLDSSIPTQASKKERSSLMSSQDELTSSSKGENNTLADIIASVESHLNSQDKDFSLEKLSISDNDNVKSSHTGELLENFTVTSSVDQSIIVQPSPQHQLSSYGENHQLSHRPFDFQRFLLQLRAKSADPIVRYVRSFLVSFTRQAPMFTTKQKIKIIRDFKTFMTEKFTLYEPFASMDEIDLENSREGLEKLLMNRLYDICFPPSNSQVNESEIKKDNDFADQVEKFSWVNGKHLDVDLDELSTKNKGGVKLDFLDYSIKELNKINNYRAPRDKIICVLNLCKIIFGFLKTAQQETNADSFVPLLILVILKAKTDHLISNIQYIENYRGEEWLNHGETGYYLSSLQGAIGFIENLSFEHLSITRDEYDAHMEAWDAHARQIQRESKALAAPAASVPSAKSIPQSASVNADVGTSPGTQMSLSPSAVLFNSAEIVSKSLSNFLSPSPQPDSGHALPLRHTRQRNDQLEPEISTQDTPQTQEAFQTLVMMFPNLDKAILQDLVYIKKGIIEDCVDTCLELVSET